MAATLSIMTTRFAAAFISFAFAFASRYRGLAFSTERRCNSKAHSLLVIPCGRSFSNLPFFFAGASAATVGRGAT
jgi:hypothetical protein